MKFSFNSNELLDLNIGNVKLMLSNRVINDVTTVKKPLNNSIIFINDINSIDTELLNNFCDSLIIINSIENVDDIVFKRNDIIISPNPRLTYAIVVQYALKRNVKPKEYKNIGNNIFVGENVIMGDNVFIEPSVTIGNNVKIGDNTSILSGVRIGDGVIIGKDCVIRNNTVIGGWGFGIEKDEEGKSYRIPHLGSVIIGDNVDIGTLNTVVSGTIDPTIIENHVMTDDHVHIAHNCKIGEGTLITACGEISGSVEIGKNVWIGPNSSIMNKIKLGENTIIGLGAVVTKTFGDNVVLAGNPADTIENVKYNRKIIKRLISKN